MTSQCIFLFLLFNIFHVNITSVYNFWYTQVTSLLFQQMIKEASGHMFVATRRRAFLRQVKVLIPQSWSNTTIDQVATTESFMKSDIRVDLPHAIYKNQPYTEQPGECGEPGEYIHLTPEYLTQRKFSLWWGPPGKSLVPQWAQLRWGVFDEMGYPNDERYPLFYSTGREDASRVDVHTVYYRPNYCANAYIEGIEKNVQRVSYSGCRYASDNLPDGNCRFHPDDNQTATSSLMSYPFILSNSIIEFCDRNTHLYESPNKQNDKCQGLSTWQVMEKHQDFANNVNPPRAAPPEEPSVIVIQSVFPSYAVVMDYSGSMSTESRIVTLQKTAQRWLLHEAPDNSFVSLIRFSSSPAKVLVPLTQLSDKTVRQTLANKILTDNQGGTSIGSGLRTAVQTLSGKHNKNILIITDGEENEDPRISDVLNEVIQARICVITVAFGSNADPNLEVLSDKTGCKSYTVNDNDQNTMLQDAFQETLTRQPGKEIRFIDIMIYESPEIKTRDYAVENYFSVDNSVGKNLVFRLQTDKKDHIREAPRLTDPYGNIIYAKDYDDISFLWTIIIPLADVGMWSGKSSRRRCFKNVKCPVTARQRDAYNPSPQPTRVWVRNKPDGVSALNPKIKIFAEVKQGNNPIPYNAHVRAIVTQPDSVNAPPDIYILQDSGINADSMKNDGIYSGYMTKFSSVGRYNIKAEVRHSTWTGCYSVLFYIFNIRVNHTMYYVTEPPAPCCGSVMPVDDTNTAPTGNFTRVATGGSLKVTEIPPPGSDTMPPARVVDLKVNSINLNSKKIGFTSITLSWTAPGDDLDAGIASGYVFRLSSNYEDLLEEKFDQAPLDTLLLVSPEELQSYSVFLESGSQLNLTINFRRSVKFDQKYFVALRAIDEADNKSKVSNIVVFTVEEKLDMPKWALKKMEDMQKNIANFEALKGKIFHHVRPE
nr:LOW QUALITY PROTEIN: calcium-activated chloride channel regulator 4-like [Cherax quadricarinatus]